MPRTSSLEILVFFLSLAPLRTSTDHEFLDFRCHSLEVRLSHWPHRSDSLDYAQVTFTQGSHQYCTKGASFSNPTPGFCQQDLTITNWRIKSPPKILGAYSTFSISLHSGMEKFQSPTRIVTCSIYRDFGKEDSIAFLIAHSFIHSVKFYLTSRCRVT